MNLITAYMASEGASKAKLHIGLIRRGIRLMPYQLEMLEAMYVKPSRNHTIYTREAMVEALTAFDSSLQIEPLVNAQRMSHNRIGLSVRFQPSARFVTT